METVEKSPVKRLFLIWYSFTQYLWVLAENEYRICMRLSRTKFVFALAFVTCALYFVIVTHAHMQTSGLAPMFGVVSPRYLASLLGSNFLALFCVGVLVLAFDMQSRDENNHIQEVFASKPVGSVELFLGRLLGIFLCMGIPLVAVVVLAVVYGWFSSIFSIPFGEPIELLSVGSLLLLDVVPNFIFFGLLVLLLGSFVRPRFVAFLLSICCLYGVLWLNGRLPLWISTPLQTVSGNVIFPSELTPTFLTTEIVFNRAALVLMGIGLLYWLSVLHPRNTSSAVSQGVKGLYAFGAGIFLIAGMFGVQFYDNQQTSVWKRVHNAHYEPELFPDVHHIEGTVEIYPGRAISLDLKMLVSVVENSDGEEVLFSFNPGYVIEKLSIGEEDIGDYKFRNGLLKIPQPYFADEVVTVQLQAKGRPQPQFAYLDTVERISKIFGPEVRQLRYLGTKNYIFHPEFVVLMPGIKWYPVAGTATNEENWAQRPKDFFTVDLKVSVPRKWVVAGPAQRKLIQEEKRTTYLFHTSNPIPQLALIASQFEHTSQQIEGIEFEVLYSRAHRRNFEALALTGEALRKYVQESLADVRTTGLDYPYTVISLVEVPASLRVYGGGRRMDTVLGMPGIIMMRETTLPTLHLDSFHEKDDFQWARVRNWSDVEWMESKQGHLKRYFGIELYAGNFLSQSYRSIVSDQTGVTGPHAQLLNLILEQVIQLSLLEYEFSFDFDLAFDREVLDFTFVEPAQILNLSKRGSDIGLDKRRFTLRETRWYKLTADDVLGAIESVPLVSHPLNSTLDKIGRRALRLRALAVSRLMIDTLGSEKLNSIIATLVDRYRGKNFSYEDFIAEAHSHGVFIEHLIDDLMHSSSLPGFILSNVTQRLVETDDEEALPYQVSFILKNGESVSGYCLLTPINHHSQLINRDFIEFKQPIYVRKNQSLEVVLESRAPIIDLVIEPYLSLNRTALRHRVTSVADWYNWRKEKPIHIGPSRIVSIRELDLEPSEDDTSIVIDDLDAGFSIVNQLSRFNFQPLTHLARRLAGTSVKEEIRGLPAFQRDYKVVPIDTWERKSDSTAYGKYWKTLAMNQGGNGKTFAKFATSLPTTGKWRLEYFLPAGNFEQYRHFIGVSSRSNIEFSMGIANIDIYGAATEIRESIDISAVAPGWYLLGEYAIENTDVEVWVSNPDEDDLIFADAIRWSPVEIPE